MESRLKLVAKYQRTRLAWLTKAQQKAAGPAQDVVKAVERAPYQVLVASVDGTVQQLSAHTVGGVVAPAQALMVVAPPTAVLRSRPGVEPNAIPRDKPQDKSTDRMPGSTTSSEPKGEEPVMLRASRSTARKCRSRRTASIYLPARRSAERSRLARAQPFPTCFRRHSNTKRKNPRGG